MPQGWANGRKDHCTFLRLSRRVSARSSVRALRKRHVDDRATLLADPLIDYLYSSELGRTVQTAAITHLASTGLCVLPGSRLITLRCPHALHILTINMWQC